MRLFAAAQPRHATYDQRRVLYARSGGRCFYCDAPVAPGRWHADHVLAFSKGGRTELSNLVVACAQCNMAKFNMDVRTFQKTLRRRGLAWRDREAARHRPRYRATRRVTGTELIGFVMILMVVALLLVIGALVLLFRFARWIVRRIRAWIVRRRVQTRRATTRAVVRPPPTQDGLVDEAPEGFARARNALQGAEPAPLAVGERVILVCNRRPATGALIGSYPVGSKGTIENVLSNTAIVRFDADPRTKEVVAFGNLTRATQLTTLPDGPMEDQPRTAASL